MILEKPLKEKSSQNNHSNDNYNYNSDTITKSQLFDFERTIVFAETETAIKQAPESSDLPIVDMNFSSLSDMASSIARDNNSVVGVGSRSFSVVESSKDN